MMSQWQAEATGKTDVNTSDKLVLMDEFTFGAGEKEREAEKE